VQFILSFGPSTNEYHQVEVVGSVEEGISVAAWSPDETVLVLVTGTRLHRPSPAFLSFTVQVIRRLSS
jgi:hypothetical protein